MNRNIERVVTAPQPEPGFIGEGHTAVEVLSPDALAASDPFVLLMDDRLDIKQGRHIGGAHPHAGLETVTLVLEGELEDADEGKLTAGDALWMTAGRGIIHNESVFVEGKARVLQLWIRLSKAEQGAEPRFQLIKNPPTFSAPGVTARLYSGESNGLRSPTLNHVPTTLVDVTLSAGKSFEQELPRSYNGFIYVLDGAVNIGDTRVEKGQVAWIDRPTGTGTSSLVLAAAADARAVIYMGEPQHEPLVHYGPFVADSKQNIVEAHLRYQSGQFVRMSELAHKKGKSHVTLDGSAPRAQ